MDENLVLDLELRNYRPFRDSRPARLQLRAGETAFVGVNNAGKSSILRFFYEFRRLFSEITPGSNFLLQAAAGQNPSFSFPPEVPDPSDVFNNQTRRPILVKVRFPRNLDAARLRRDDSAREVTGFDIEIPVDATQARISFFVDGSETALDTAGRGYHQDGFHFIASNGTFRLANAFEAADILANTLYIGPFRNAINVGTREQYYDIQIGQSFIQQWKRLLTGTRKADNQAALRLMADIQRVFGFQSFTINASQDEQTLQFFINGRSYRLGELGAGLAQFVVAIINAAVRTPRFILIDEPELNLHPKLQLEFLTLLASHARDGVLFATHAMGLARAGGDRVYTVRLIADGDSELRPLEGTRDLVELLGEIGFSAYEDLGYSGVLLVEGPTELKAVQQLLRLYGRDQKYVLIPLGGGELINTGSEHQLVELARISKTVVALIDSEKDSAEASLDAKRTAFVKAAEKAGIRVHVLQRRAIENYFSERTLSAVFAKTTRSLRPYEKLNSSEQNWPKADNWKAARETSRTELEGTDLGEFLNSL